MCRVLPERRCDYEGSVFIFVCTLMLFASKSTSMMVPNFPYSLTSHDEAIRHVEPLSICCFQLAVILFKWMRFIYWGAIERVGMEPAGIHHTMAETTAPTVLLRPSNDGPGEANLWFCTRPAIGHQTPHHSTHNSQLDNSATCNSTTHNHFTHPTLRPVTSHPFTPSGFLHHMLIK
jgi:hypothetical protein